MRPERLFYSLCEAGESAVASVRFGAEVVTALNTKVAVPSRTRSPSVSSRSWGPLDLGPSGDLRELAAVPKLYLYPSPRPLGRAPLAEAAAGLP